MNMTFDDSTPGNEIACIKRGTRRSLAELQERGDEMCRQQREKGVSIASHAYQ